MIAVLLSVAFSWFFLRALIPQLRMQLLDQPNARSSHSQPTPRGGGVAFVLLGSASSGIALLIGQDHSVAALPLLAAPLAVVGLLDDRHNLPASWRYAVQLLTAVLMLGVSPLFQKFSFAVASGSWLFLVALALLLIAVTAVINFTNFMDGLDGLVAGCMAVSIAALAIDLIAPWSLWAPGWVRFLVSLSGIGAPPSCSWGMLVAPFSAVFAGLVLQASSWTEAFGYLLVATPLLADACLCVLRRLLAGQRVFQAHRLHLFQRLHQAGWTHAQVSLTYIAVTSLLSFALLVGGWLWVFGLAVVACCSGFGWTNESRCPFLWRPRVNGQFFFHKSLMEFVAHIQAAFADWH